MSEHLATVEQERQQYPAPEYDAQGNLLNPLGEANAWAIVNATAWAWRDEGWGLLIKRTGTNWNGYSIDVLVNVFEQQAVDCLGSSETLGIPQWSPIAWESTFAQRWAAPLPPEDPEPPPPDPPVDDLDTRVAYLEADLADLRRALSSWIG